MSYLGGEVYVLGNRFNVKSGIDFKRYVHKVACNFEKKKMGTIQTYELVRYTKWQRRPQEYFGRPFYLSVFEILFCTFCVDSHHPVCVFKIKFFFLIEI